MWKTWVQSLGQEDPLEKEMATHSSSCLGNSMERGAWQAIIHRVTKSQAQLTDFTFTFKQYFNYQCNYFIHIEKTYIFGPEQFNKRSDSILGSNTYVLISNEIGGNEKVRKILNDVRVIKLTESSVFEIWNKRNKFLNLILNVTILSYIHLNY